MNKKQQKYWNNFYQKNGAVTYPSKFAKFVSKCFDKLSLIDLGCGNGRDTIYLSNFFTSVIGVDSSFQNNKKMFIKSDFVTYNVSSFDVIYMRFSWHAITNEQQNQLLKNLKQGQYLCVETRSVLGKFEGDHFRNFTDKKKLISQLRSFEILYMEEKKGFAPYKGEDPICIRFIALKK